MTRSGSLRRYNSGIKNAHKRLTSNNEDGVAVRATYYNATGNKIYLEKNYQRAVKKDKGTGITITSTKRAFKEINEKRIKGLREDFKQLKKEGLVSGSFKKFERANRDPDYTEVRESFNSP